MTILPRHFFRVRWADYFDSQGVRYAFYSAANAAAIQQTRKEVAEALAHAEEVSRHASEKGEDDDEADDDETGSPESESEDENEDDMYFSAEGESEDGQDLRARVLSVVELEELFVKMAPDLSRMFL